MYEDFPNKGVVNEPESGEPSKKSWRPRHQVEERKGRKGWARVMRNLAIKRKKIPEDAPYAVPGSAVITFNAARYFNDAEQKRSAEAPYRTDIDDEEAYDPFIE